MDRRPMGARVPPLPAALPATAAAMPPPRGSRFRSPRPLQPRGGTAPPEPSPARRAPRPGAAPFPAAAAPEPLRRCRPAGRRRRGGEGGRRGREGTPPLRPSCTCRARSIAATRGNTSESFSEQQKAQPWNEPVTQRRREARAQQLLEPASERGPGLLPRFISYFSRGGRPTKNSRRCGAVGRAEQRCFPPAALGSAPAALCALPTALSSAPAALGAVPAAPPPLPERSRVAERRGAFRRGCAEVRRSTRGERTRTAPRRSRGRFPFVLSCGAAPPALPVPKRTPRIYRGGK